MAPGKWFLIIFMNDCRNCAVTNALAANGHNVTVLSVDIDRQPPANVHYILMEDMYPFMFSEDDRKSMFLHTDVHSGIWSQVEHYFGFLEKMCLGMVLWSVFVSG